MDRVRDEAERLVAAAIAAVSTSMRGRPGFATGSAECCVCPVCRAIAAIRDPAPELAERLAAGVGDLAAGVTSFLRTLQRPDAPTQRPAPGDGDEFWESLRRKAADAAKAAARPAPTTSDPSTMDPGVDTVDSSGVDPLDSPRADTVDDDRRAAPQPGPEPAPAPAPARKVAKKAVAKKAAPPPVKAAKTAAPARKVAKKAAKKAPPPTGS